MFTTYRIDPQALICEARSEGESVVSVLLCASGDQITYLETVLGPRHGLIEGVDHTYELFFRICVGHHEPTDLDERFYSSPEARRYIAPEIRGEIVPLVCKSTRLLVSNVKPIMIFRETVDVHPLPKQFGKHEAITSVLRQSGYDVLKAGLDDEGKHFWYHSR